VDRADGVPVVWWVDLGPRVVGMSRLCGAWVLDRHDVPTTLHALTTTRTVLATAAGRSLLDEHRIAVERVLDPAATLAAVAAGREAMQEGRSGARVFVFTVTLSDASNAPVSVNYSTANGTATAGSDYYAQSGTLTFTPGQTSKTIGIVVNGDRKREADETFFVNLSNVVGAQPQDSQGLGTILNDDR
jgi:hypothetical protein